MRFAITCTAILGVGLLTVGAHIAGAQGTARETAGWHIVRPGDTLESIAKKLLGRKSRWTRIRDANPGLKPERLRPGQTILIPIP